MPRSWLLVFDSEDERSVFLEDYTSQTARIEKQNQTPHLFKCGVYNAES